ncbi:MAG: hypothetical protein ACTHU0_03705 [Kofleriaceae bacterium]
MRFSLLLLFALTTLAACEIGDSAPYTEHEEDSDFDPVPNDRAGLSNLVPPVFDANNVIADGLLDTAETMTVASMQKFLERSPYNNKSWLATATFGGKSAAALIVEAANAEGIHPIALLARMQVEASLVSKTARPTQKLIDRALGCGCPDGAACNAQYKGLEKQLACGARTLRKWYDASEAGTSAWRKGVAKKTLDPRTVTPKNHATASLYSYTPWVLVGSGGNWLVWNVTKKYVRHADVNSMLQ